MNYFIYRLNISDTKYYYIGHSKNQNRTKYNHKSDCFNQNGHHYNDTKKPKSVRNSLSNNNRYLIKFLKINY